MIAIVLAAMLSCTPNDTKQLYGFGLVIGLKGTGSDSSFTIQCTQDMLERNGVPLFLAQPLGRSLAKSLGISAVLITAETATRPGGRCDVIVSSIDDASSLKHGYLLKVKLRHADDRVDGTARGVLEPHSKKAAKIVNGAKLGIPMGIMRGK